MMGIFTYKSERLHGLDHLRALAILLVMIFHYGKGVPAWLLPIQKFGWTGVDLFFVLSGFLIGSQLLAEIKEKGNLSFKQFYIKRFFRIIPAYFTMLLIYFLLDDLREGAGLPSIWRFITFTQNFGLDVGSENSFSHAWSLCIEEQFYLLLPIIIFSVFHFRIQKITPVLILALMVVGFVLRLYNWNEYVQPFIDEGDRRQMVYGFIGKVYYPSYNRMDGLLIGVSIAAIFHFKPNIKERLIRHGNIILILGLGLFVLAYILFNNFISFKTTVFGFPIISISYGLLVIAAISPGSLLYKYQLKASLIIATLSYAIYLSHKQVYKLTKLAIEKFDMYNLEILNFWICLFMATLGGFILYFIVEKPFLFLRRRIIQQIHQKTN